MGTRRSVTLSRRTRDHKKIKCSVFLTFEISHVMCSVRYAMGNVEFGRQIRAARGLENVQIDSTMEAIKVDKIA